MKRQITVIEGNRGVVINEQENHVWANIYVNARNGIEGADITRSRWEGKTVAGALRWAKKRFEGFDTSNRIAELLNQEMKSKKEI